MNYKRDIEKIYVTLEPGERVNKSLYQVAVNEGITCAWVNGIGAINAVHIGYMDIENKKYQDHHFDNHFELLSLVGNITLKEGSPFVHTHITFSDNKYKVYGGHLFDAKVTAAGEFLITIGKEPINRKYVDSIGLHTWCLNENN